MTDYGIDTSCWDDLYPGRTVTGARLIAEAVYRRLTTARGQLPGDPNYGIDVTELMHDGATAAELATLRGRIAAEISKDDRIIPESLSVKLDLAGAGVARMLTIRIRGLSVQNDVFELVLGVDGVTVDLLKVT